MFSLVYTGSFEFDDGVDKTALIAHLSDCLRKAGARAVGVSGDSVSFRGGFFRWVSYMSIQVPFGHGQLIVDDKAHEVRYRLSFRQLILAATIMVGLGAASAWFASRHDPIVPFALAFGCLWMVGTNLMISTPRFQRFLRNAIDTVPIGRQSVGR